MAAPPGQFIVLQAFNVLKEALSGYEISDHPEIQDQTLIFHQRHPQKLGYSKNEFGSTSLIYFFQ